MRKPNYSYEKRKRELAKQAKREAKRQRKQAQNADDTEATDGSEPASSPPTTQPRD